MSRPVIPTFEPEIYAAKVDNSPWKDGEKVATTTLTEIQYCGIDLSSRYGKAQEINDMMGLVDGLDVRLRDLVKSIWCDSKACACYSIACPSVSYEVLQEIVSQIDIASKGHNGISASSGEIELFLDPRWPDELGWPDELE